MPTLADIASTGLAAAKRANIRLGDLVAILAHRPIGLATVGARPSGLDVAEKIHYSPPGALPISPGAVRHSPCVVK